MSRPAPQLAPLAEFDSREDHIQYLRTERVKINERLWRRSLIKTGFMLLGAGVLVILAFLSVNRHGL